MSRVNYELSTNPEQNAASIPILQTLAAVVSPELVNLFKNLASRQREQIELKKIIEAADTEEKGRFIIKNRILYHVDKTGKTRYVIPEPWIGKLIINIHEIYAHPEDDLKQKQKRGKDNVAANKTRRCIPKSEEEYQQRADKLHKFGEFPHARIRKNKEPRFPAKSKHHGSSQAK
ncbi:hypothetical protein KPH14_007502 [Odynerus spinipes]|uniref:Uncharacterized protein n=1 Tax=Odynerus spinipes TaxID=1348599 RepID=A0AAD9VJN6_9HYME|nr:hypothetical protein KPH14_007502 [Odynerus spinipes]